MRSWPARLVLAGALAATAGGCGDGGTTYSAEEFVAAANREGAGLELGEALHAPDQGAEIFAARVEEAPEGEEAPGHRDEHGSSASVVVTEDDDAAIAEFERCETALTLTCYRAANVVLRIESEDPAQLARVEAAIRALGSGG